MTVSLYQVYFFYLFMHWNRPALNLVELKWGENLQKQCFPYSRENIARRQLIFVLHMWEKKLSNVKQQTNKQILKIQQGTTKNQPVISGSLILVMLKKPLQKIFLVSHRTEQNNFKLSSDLI